MGEQHIIFKTSSGYYGHYRHDCKACRYRGSFVTIPEAGEARISDVYVCTEERGETIIMRRGNDGPEYMSFPRSIVEQLGGDLGSDWQLALQMVREFKSHKAQAPELTFYPPDQGMPYRIEKTLRIDMSDDYGGRYIRYIILSWPSQRLNAWDPNWTEDAKEDIVERSWPSTFCQHSYDCCGNYYASNARIRKLPSGRWIVRQDWTQNV